MLTLVAIFVTIGLVQGGIAPRIVNGRNTRIEYYPHQVSIDLNGNFNCGGSIISTTTILTAAHCSQPYELSSLIIRAGSSYRGVGGQLRSVIEKYEHEAYDNVTITNDIAVFILSQPLLLNDKVQIIRLALYDNQLPGASATVTGWGLTETKTPSIVLRELVQQKMPENTCQSSSANYDRTIQVCYKARIGSSACMGDSGGPLVIRTFGGFEQVGIVSYGKEFCLGIFPTYYTKVSHYARFLRRFV